MNIERSLVFPFKAPGAVGKIVLGGLFSALFFTVFFAFVVVGFLIHVLCAALEGRDAKLPDWTNLKGFFYEGLPPVLIILAYSAPIVVITIIEIQIVYFGYFAGIYIWPLELVTLIVISLLLPLALIRCVVNSSLKSAFEFGKIFEFLKTNTKIYLKAWVIAILVSLVAYIIGFIVLLAIGLLSSFGGQSVLMIGLALAALVFFIAQFIAALIMVHLFAQAYRASTPFVDDRDGIIRASMAVPPPLRS